MVNITIYPIDVNKEKECEFGTLKQGEFFVYNNTLYIKVEFDDYYFNALEVGKSSKDSFSAYTKVIPIDVNILSNYALKYLQDCIFKI